ncbi:MAG: hypothetical protein CL869_00800 [Cytophagia bacterium]|nr:hypothetical protein [Cytophagia bacterium]|tara:strand:+ start:313 stop:963 length:651 start_codon:yes stop_codon:yes gene_type:complete
MINPDKSRRFITPERASVLLPTIISAGIAFIITSAFVIPQYINSNKIFYEFKEFMRKKDELPNLKNQYKIINQKLKKLNIQKGKIIDLVSGKSNLDTFLNTLGFLGDKNQIQFSSIIPSSIIKYVPDNNTEIQNQLNINTDPLLVEGIKKNIIEVKFEAEYENLLAFIRDLEFNENVILISDININTLKKAKNDSQINYDSFPLEVSLKLTIYGKI